MKNRFVLGIVLVLCVQVAFEVLMALEQAGERLFHARVTTAVPAPVDAEPAMVATIPDAEDHHGSPPSTLPLTVIRNRPLASHFTSFRDEHKSRPLFETIRITYPARPAAVPMTATPKATTTVARAERTEKEERSLFARTVVPVVKKPYEFIKLVGSKLR